jgi:hypothetical protein
MNEELEKKQTVRLAEGYFTKYKKHMQSFEKSLVGKAMNISEHHLVQLGKQLDQWEVYKSICEANGSLNTLGELPKVALDVITATMSNSVLPVIASTQTIESQKSIIWFKNVKALDSKGNVVAGDTLVDPRTGLKTPSGYASNEVIGEEAVAATVAAQVVYGFAVNGGESVRSQFVKVYLDSDNGIFAQDFEGKGVLLGAGMSGTIDYTTGAISVTLAADPGAGDKVLVDYQQNLEEMSDIRRITSELDSTGIEAKAYALKGVMGMFQMFAMKKQFGDSALDDMATDLTREINAEIGGDFIRKYVSVAQGTTQFSLTVPTNISEKQHRESYAFRMADAESTMIGNVGRGTVKVMVVGREHAALVRGLDGFQLLSDGNSIGAHIFGTYKGITYVRVPEEALLAAKSGIGLYTGGSALESAGVYAPFMPLTVQDAPLGPNPLTSQKVAATMAGTKVVVPGYCTKFNLVA